MLSTFVMCSHVSLFSYYFILLSVTFLDLNANRINVEEFSDISNSMEVCEFLLYFCHGPLIILASGNSTVFFYVFFKHVKGLRLV